MLSTSLVKHGCSYQAEWPELRLQEQARASGVRSACCGGRVVSGGGWSPGDG